LDPPTTTSASTWLATQTRESYGPVFVALEVVMQTCRIWSWAVHGTLGGRTRRRGRSCRVRDHLRRRASSWFHSRALARCEFPRPVTLIFRRPIKLHRAPRGARCGHRNRSDRPLLQGSSAACRGEAGFPHVITPSSPADILMRSSSMMGRADSETGCEFSSGEEMERPFEVGAWHRHPPTHAPPSSRRTCPSACADQRRCARCRERLR
jgi:hypothetical protein